MRPFDSKGMDAAMSDRRVRRLTFDVPDPDYRGRKFRHVTHTVWERGCLVGTPDYRGMSPTGQIQLDVHFGDGRIMSMRTYLETEAANAVRKPKKRRNFPGAVPGSAG